MRVHRHFLVRTLRAGDYVGAWTRQTSSHRRKSARVRDSRTGGSCSAHCSRRSTPGRLEGVEFATRVGAAADAANHHPDLTITYPRVHVLLTTHDADGLTSRDVDMARTISAIAADLGIASIRRRPLNSRLRSTHSTSWRQALLGSGTRLQASRGRRLPRPLRPLPRFWFQQMDAPRTQRNRIHIDVTVPHDVAQQRIAAAISAGGVSCPTRPPRLLDPCRHRGQRSLHLHLARPRLTALVTRRSHVRRGGRLVSMRSSSRRRRWAMTGVKPTPVQNELDVVFAVAVQARSAGPRSGPANAVDESGTHTEHARRAARRLQRCNCAVGYVERRAQTGLDRDDADVGVVSAGDQEGVVVAGKCSASSARTASAVADGRTERTSDWRRGTGLLVDNR